LGSNHLAILAMAVFGGVMGAVESPADLSFNCCGVTVRIAK
jgi:hypothetical protein